MNTGDSMQQESVTDMRAERLVSGRGLLTLHLFVAMQTVILLSGWDAIVYTIFPFMLPQLFVDATLRSPFFSLLCLTSASLTWMCVHRAIHGHIKTYDRWSKAFVGITFAMWIPVFCGEIIRFVLMAPALASVPDHCHGGQSLLESLRDISSDHGYRKPHAWLAKSDRVFLWSYRTLDFEPTGDWADVDMIVGRCGKAR